MRRFTIRRGSLLRFDATGACAALDGARCRLHQGRPLACRLYPLGIERAENGREERFVSLEPAASSLGVYGDDLNGTVPIGSVDDFLQAQDVEPYLAAIARYRRLIRILRDRARELADFEKIEPREFWRKAVREALAESDYDPNPLIDAMFDSDGLVGLREDEEDTVRVHVAALEARARRITDANLLASAAVMLAVSLGYSPHDVVEV
jgi:Fe-S-cluster containining protein